MKPFDTATSMPEWLTALAEPKNWQAFWSQPPSTMPGMPGIDEFGKLIDPNKMLKLQQEYTEGLTQLWENFLASKNIPVTDRRFSDSSWQSNAVVSFNVATYLHNAQYLMRLTESVDMPARAKQKLRFTVQQVIDAMSPANFLVTNPEAQRKIIETKGESLTQGITNLLEDMRKGRISQSDEAAFEVGRNVATTEGMVVYENPLFQLIQYKPLTDKVYERPLLLIPPCINKYYIMDLQPDNSLVRYGVEQGHTVYLISWCNPDASLGDQTWDDYIENAAIKAIHTVMEISGQKQINTLGFCVGGTILSTALAVLAARGEYPAASVTLLTSLLDFTDTGIIDVYVDEAQVSMREQAIGKGGLMPGRDFASAFSSLRPNDLVWNYVKANYLKGEFPPAFDLLYWNGDSTNLPGPMFCWYLRNLYLEDNLKVPGRLKVAGEKVDLGRIDAPCFIYGSREDHIVPWTSAYASTHLLNPKHPERNRFVLGASGHIAGVINPPAKKKRSFWTNPALPATPDEWFENASETPGSWWTQWSEFLSAHAGEKVASPKKFGNNKFKPIEPAPGRYVKVKAE